MIFSYGSEQRLSFLLLSVYLFYTLKGIGNLANIPLFLSLSLQSFPNHIERVSAIESLRGRTQLAFLNSGEKGETFK